MTNEVSANFLLDSIDRGLRGMGIGQERIDSWSISIWIAIALIVLIAFIANWVAKKLILRGLKSWIARPRL